MMKFKDYNALIVEDDATQQLIVQKLLETEGITTKAVSNGLEAWEQLKSKQFNFIIMDVKMPNHDGLEVVQWIREETDPYYKNIPIFALTSFSTPGYTQQVIKAGMNAHLVKPLQIENLLDCLNKHFPAKSS
jgi:CheY-like chemotaxis protein